MHLTVREEERLQIWTAAEMARRRLARGVKLNEPEAIALISDEIMERAREGSIPMVVDMIQYGANLLKSGDVMEGVRDMVKIIQVEALFPDGTKLVTVMNPIGNEEGDSHEDHESGGNLVGTASAQLNRRGRGVQGR